MTDYPIHTAETAPKAETILRRAQKANGFVPNLYATMAEAPALLEGYVTLSATFDKSDLSATERQIVLLVNSRLNGCSYCMAAHTMIAKMQGVPEDVVEALRSGTELSDPKLEALRSFAIKINESRGWPEQSDLDAFFAAGYEKRNVLEVVLGTALKVMSNYTNHIASTPVDAAFAEAEWAPSDAVGATD